MGLVYGGGRVGLMGDVADSCKAAGGRVIGIIPNFLEKREVGHTALDELIVVDSMHAGRTRSSFFPAASERWMKRSRF